MSYALRPVGYLGALSGPHEDEMRRNAQNMANELWARSQRLAESMSSITRATAFSSRALNEAFELAQRAGRAVGVDIQLTQVQFVSSVQAAVAQIGAMAVSIKTLADSPDIVRVWPVIGLLATHGANLDQATRAMTGGARSDASAAAGLGIGLMFIGPVIVAAALYLAYQAGMRNAENALEAGNAALRAVCPTPDSCTTEERLRAWRGGHEAVTGPSVGNLVTELLRNARAAHESALDVFRKPIFYVSVIGGIVFLGAAAYAAWPYLQTVRGVGARQARRLKATEES